MWWKVFCKQADHNILPCVVLSDTGVEFEIESYARTQDLIFPYLPSLSSDELKKATG